VHAVSLLIILPKPEPVTGDVRTLKSEKVRKGGGKGKEKTGETGEKNLDYLFRLAKVSCQ
jgi:hypothetical protein